jgi:hypothetical protein
VPGAIKEGISVAEQCVNQGKKIGGVAFYFRDWSKEDGYHVGYTLGEKMYVNHGLFVNQALKDVNYIDEETCFFYNGDGDLCLSMWQKGYEIIDSPKSFVEHYPHANLDVRSTNYERYKSDIANYLSKWTGIFYNPALNNLGKQKQLLFNDLTRTGEKFKTLHDQVVAERPDVIRAPSRFSRCMKQIGWKYASLNRKIQSFFR